MLLQRKTAFITGSNRGIGRAILELFATNGYNLIAHARKCTPEFEQEIKELSSKEGVQVTPVYFDLTDYQAMRSVIQSIFSQKISIDILVNNAGIAHGGFFQMTSIRQIKDVFEVNLFAQMQLTQLAMRSMIKQKQGSIINISSIFGIDLSVGNCAYGVSKAAFIAFTQTLAAECASFGIRVNAIAPGVTDTDMIQSMGQKTKEQMIANSAMGRLARPEEVAQVALFLASDHSQFVNGQVIRVDGGKK